MVLTIRDGDEVIKDPSDTKTYKFDWDTDNLAATVTIVVSSWTITTISSVPSWAATKAYVLGDLVLVGGVIYTAILAHTDFTPPNAVYWSVVITDTPLTKDSESVLAGDRSTQVRLLAGTLGLSYEIANKIRTSETPYQEKERSFRVFIENQ